MNRVSIQPAFRVMRAWLLILPACFCLFQVLYGQGGNADSQDLPLVKTVDLATIDPSVFTQDEWYVPYYLKNFAAVANSVVSKGDNRGFIDIVVWRTPDVNKPYNARIMESILSLAWFYTHQKPWNVYYADPALKARIEAALAFWCNMQNDDGRFSEYAPRQWSLAPTAFATKFVGRALYLLKDGPAIDPAILERTQQALRKAFYISFTDPKLWEHGRNFTNQYENLWGGVLMYLRQYPDAEIEKLFHQRLEASMKEFQSPCGYFYEKNGPDWAYNLSTHHSDLHVAWHYVKGTPLQHYFVDKTERWYDWFSYNAVKEPGSSRYYINKAVETRQQKWYVVTDTLENPSAARWTPQAEFIPVARAFALSKEEYASATQRLYQRMRSQYPRVDELRQGEFWSFSPYAFLHNELKMWLPSGTEKNKAVNNLPYLSAKKFNEVRKDNRNNTVYTFVRRPFYYGIFNSGTMLTPNQRYGLGLVWNPATGTVFQSQSNSTVAAWGTKAEGGEQVYEAGDIAAEFTADGKRWEPSEGKNQPKGNLNIRYPLRSAGIKTVEFLPEKIKITVLHQGAFTEVIPLLAYNEGSIRYTDKSITLENKKGTMTIRIGSEARVKKLNDVVSTRGGHKDCYVVEVSAKDRLEYEFSFK
jgi:hypothetical protein